MKTIHSKKWENCGSKGIDTFIKSDITSQIILNILKKSEISGYFALLGKIVDISELKPQKKLKVIDKDGFLRISLIFNKDLPTVFNVENTLKMIIYDNSVWIKLTVKIYFTSQLIEITDQISVITLEITEI